jgi:hypothetical protein
VIIPFILMTFVVAMLLYIFGMNAAIVATTPNKSTQQSDAKNTNTTSSITEKTYLTFYPNRHSSPAYESFSQ